MRLRNFPLWYLHKLVWLLKQLSLFPAFILTRAVYWESADSFHPMSCDAHTFIISLSFFGAEVLFVGFSLTFTSVNEKQSSHLVQHRHFLGLSFDIFMLDTKLNQNLYILLSVLLLYLQLCTPVSVPVS